MLTSIEASQPMHDTFRSRLHFHRTHERTTEETLPSLPDGMIVKRENLGSARSHVLHHGKMCVLVRLQDNEMRMLDE